MHTFTILVVYLGFISFTIFQKPINSFVSDEYSSQKNCVTHKSILYNLIYCADDFYVNFTFDFRRRDITWIAARLTCLKHSVVRIPSDLFAKFTTYTLYKISIQDCFINDKFVKELKAAINLSPGISKSNKLIRLSSDSNAALHCHNESFIDVDGILTFEILYKSIVEIHPDFLPESFYVEIRYSNLTSLPEGIFDKAPNLIRLVIANNRLTHLSKGIFRPLTELLLLNLEGNQLNSLDSDLFKGLNKLVNLNLRDNNIRTLPDNIFSDLSNLLNLALNNNQISVINKAAFSPSEALSELNIGSNNVTQLQTETFELFPFLQRLNISNNDLKLEENVLYPPSISMLLLSDNKVPDIISKTTFVNISTLQILVMRNCSIDNIPSEFLQGANNLNYLDLGENLIHSIPRDFLKNCTALEILFLDNNYLSEVDPNIFQNKNIYSLNLRNNNLTLIGKDLFQNLTQLHILDLSYNRINYIHHQAFNNLSNLESLNLCSNNITSVFIFMLPLIRIQNLNLSNNFIQFWDTDYITWSTELRQLDVSYNILSSFIVSSFLPKLEILNLENNRNLRVFIPVFIVDTFSTFIHSAYTFPYKLTVPSLKYVDAANTNHKQMENVFRSLRYAHRFNFSSNNFTRLRNYHFIYASNNLTVDISFNNITSIVLKDTEIHPVSADTKSGINMYINIKTLHCDCYIFPLLRFHQNDVTIPHENTYVANISQSSLMCKEPESLHGQFIEDSEEWALYSLTLFGLCIL